MSDKALNSAMLELTQKIQLHFPRNINADILTAWNGCPKETLTEKLMEIFGKNPPSISPEFLIDFIGTFIVPATTKPFIAREHFIIDTSKKAKVRISYLGDNFKENFLGKIEESFAGSTLRYGRLKKSSVDAPIIAELGGEVKAETSLAEMFALMRQQPSGESGALLTNGYANIFYIRDKNRMLWAVYCNWDDGVCNVDAYSVDNPLGWGDGLQVFSRSSSES